VGVNRFAGDDQTRVPVFEADRTVSDQQAAALRRIRAERDTGAVEAALGEVRRAARGSANMLPPMREALKRRATLGEVCAVLRGEWGEYRPNVAV
jgi:methylmalonyl-CoA mutase, N-terminal domain